MHGACYIVAPNGVLDPLPAATDPREVFDQGPLHRIQLKNGWNLLWTSAGYHLAEVNQLASCLARELVKGDACLMHVSSSGSSSSAHPADDLLANWPGQGLNNPRYSWDAWAKALHLPASHSQPSSPSTQPHSSNGSSSSSSSATSHSPCSCTRRSHRTRTAHAVHARILGRRLMAHAAASVATSEAPGATTDTHSSSSSSSSSAGGDGHMSHVTWTDPAPPCSSRSLQSGSHEREQQQQRQAPSHSTPSAAHAAAGAPVGVGLHDRALGTGSPSAPVDQGHCISWGHPPPAAAGSPGASSPTGTAPPCVAATACGRGGVASGCPLATSIPAVAGADAGVRVSGCSSLGAAYPEATVAGTTQPQAAAAAGQSSPHIAAPQLVAAAGAAAAAGGCSGLMAAHAVQPSNGAGVAAQVQPSPDTGEEQHLSHVSSSSSMEVELSPGCSPGCCGAHECSSSSTGSSSSSSSSSTTGSGSSSRCAVSGGPTLQELWASSAAPWEDLPPEVLGAIVAHLGRRAAEVLPLYASSRCWQQAILGDQALLRSLVFGLQEPGQPLAADHPAAGQALGAWLRGVGDLPRLLLQAKAAHNVSASACCAQLLEAAGLPDQAMPCWQRCAKAGHLEGQLRYGLALYRGMAGVVQDAEAAFMYLSRAVKQVQGSSSSGGGSGAVSEADAVAVAAAVPPSGSSVSAQGPAAAAGARHTGLAAEVLRQAGVVLGYLYFDGEGTRGDRQEATRLFKLASDYGSKEAQQVLGWIFNTGQYG